MSWWDRFKCWWVALATTRVVGPGAPGREVCALREITAEDRAWLRGAADALDQAQRAASIEGDVSVTIVVSEELARQISTRLRGMAG